MNWLILMRLKEYGYVERAGEVLSKSMRLVEMSGFMAFHNSRTGKGYGKTNYGMSTPVVYMLSRL